MSTPATCDSYIFCSVIYGSWRVDKEQLKRSPLPNPLRKLDDEWNVILRGAREAWVSRHGKFTMWFLKKISPSLSELWGEHAIRGRGVPAEMMSLWPVREDQLPTICPLSLSAPLLSQVHVKVSVPKGIKFVGHPGKHHLTRKKCVAPGEATPTSIVLSFTELGSANITGTVE